MSNAYCAGLLQGVRRSLLKHSSAQAVAAFPAPWQRFTSAASGSKAYDIAADRIKYAPSDIAAEEILTT